MCKRGLNNDRAALLMIKLATNKGTMSEVAILHQLLKSFSVLLFDAASFEEKEQEFEKGMEDVEFRREGLARANDEAEKREREINE